MKKTSVLSKKNVKQPIDSFQVMVNALTSLPMRKYVLGTFNDTTISQPEKSEELKALLSTPSNYQGCEEQFAALLPKLLSHSDHQVKSLANIFKRENKITN